MNTPRRPPGRYDEPRHLPRPVLYTLATLLSLGLLALTYAAWDRFTGDKVRFTLLGYTVHGEGAVDVRFEVALDGAQHVRCQVRARNRDGVEVGSELVRIDRTAEDPVVVVHRLVTSQRAATGEVTRCTGP